MNENHHWFPFAFRDALQTEDSAKSIRLLPASVRGKIPRQPVSKSTRREPFIPRTINVHPSASATPAPAPARAPASDRGHPAAAAPARLAGFQQPPVPPHASMQTPVADRPAAPQMSALWCVLRRKAKQGALRNVRVALKMTARELTPVVNCIAVGD